ncbi:MAG TPA: hypothetical protein VKQ34_02125 [Candidatus Saccharimonadales bacterium]|nr:hypothetical protein [Candidatus Saccharimonadales bacterium]
MWVTVALGGNPADPSSLNKRYNFLGIPALPAMDVQAKYSTDADAQGIAVVNRTAAQQGKSDVMTMATPTSRTHEYETASITTPFLAEGKIAYEVYTRTAVEVTTTGQLAPHQAHTETVFAYCGSLTYDNEQ